MFSIMGLDMGLHLFTITVVKILIEHLERTSKFCACYHIDLNWYTAVYNFY